MPEQQSAVMVTCATMVATRLELSTSARRVVQELADEHVRASCTVVPVDEHSWAILGSLPYEGEAILAEFASREEAELALEQLATLDPDVTVR